MRYFLLDVKSDSLDELAYASANTKLNNRVYAVEDERLVEFEKKANEMGTPMMAISASSALNIMAY